MAPTPRLGNLMRKAQPGPGGPSGGSGRDTPGAGKERGGFEQDRQGWARGGAGGKGGPRPPAYTPNDDGERGGYKDRLSNATKTARLMIDNGHFQY